MTDNVFRLNIIDQRSSVSLLGPAHSVKAVMAAISHGASTWQEILARVRRYDPDWADAMNRGLLQFEEFHHPIEPEVEEPADSIDAGAPFRIWDMPTRRHSMEPAQLGLVIFNLKEQRIIQVQNNYGDLPRQARSRIRMNGRPTATVYHYKLPEEWAIVP
jgi:hypothetical protein